MKIAIMLRHYNQHGGGVKVYTQGLLRELLALETPHEFVLIYRDPQLIGTYNNFRHVREIAVNSRSALTWDQMAINQVNKKEKFDLIFNPKYSLPLSANCRTVFVCHGLDWFVMPKWSKLIDRISHRVLVPRYAKKADAIIAVSNITREHVLKYLKVPSEKVHTVYLGVDQVFRKSIPDQILEEIRHKFRLPKKFFLFVGQIYPPKNFGRLLQAYAKVGPELGISLVVAGEHRWLCGKDLSLIENLGITDWIVRPGWIDRETLPAFYKMSQALLMPSLYEACPSPPIEAMACGCPVVTSDRYGTKEIADNAAEFVNPEDIDSIAKGMRKVIIDEELRQHLISAGHERAQSFSWERCARETLSVFENL